MGYACPVCETPQQDGEHLANHLAFTAMLRGGDHEAWLSETVPEWETIAPETLADAVVDHAPEAEYDEVFEDTTDEHGHGQGHGHGQDHGHGHAQATPGRANPSGRGYDETADEAVVEGVVAEAQQLTAEMYGLDGDDTTDEGTDADGTNADPSDSANTDTNDATDTDADDATDTDADDATDTDADGDRV